MTDNKIKLNIPEWFRNFLYPEELDPEIVKHRKTIHDNKWSYDYFCWKWQYHSPEEILNDPIYEKQLEYEDKGRYRTNEIKLKDEGQIELKQQFMELNIKAVLCLKLPSKSYCKMARVKTEYNALQKYRRVIREIQRAYLGCSHWEKHPAFDFVLIHEHGKENIWHCHIGIIPPEDIDIDLFMYKLYLACKKVNEKYGFGKKVIYLEPVFAKEGICTYLVKEFKQKEQTDHNCTQLSMYYTMETLFHVSFEKKPKESEAERKERQRKRGKFKELIGMIKTAFDKKKKGILNIPNPLNKLAGRIYRIFRR